MSGFKPQRPAGAAMTILAVHNFYQQPGGEDEVFRQEAQLLEKHGHRVILHQAHNDAVSRTGSLQMLAKTIFNTAAYRELRALLRQTRPDILHVHNTFPLLSPAVYYAAAAESVPVVQTLHNYRLLCPAGVLFRDGGVCERCLDTAIPWPSVQHACYKGSRLASAATTAMLTVHRLLKTFDKYVTTYIAVSDFAAAKFIQGGLPPDKLVVKPNFIEPDPGRGRGSGNYCMFVGRLTPEKGIHTLLKAWTGAAPPPFDLEIAGDGELASEVAQAAADFPRIRWLGRLQKPELYERMKNAVALVVPSTWYEPFGVVLAEAFAMGVPVVASRIGALAALVDHGRTGLLCAPGDAEDLSSQISWLQAHPVALAHMRDEARRQFETHYAGDRNYLLLMDIYRNAIAGSSRTIKTSPIPSGRSTVSANDKPELIQIGSERL
jgi:glycosyltransferase involved in cell wall biosynthesis